MNSRSKITPESIVGAIPLSGAFSYLRGLQAISVVSPPIVISTIESRAGFHHGWIDEKISTQMEPSVSEVVRISQALFSDVLEFEYLCYHTTELETYLRSTGVVVRARRGVGRLINRKRMLVLELLHVTIQEIIRDFENGTSIFASEAEFWRDPRSSEERAAQGL